MSSIVTMSEVADRHSGTLLAAGGVFVAAGAAFMAVTAFEPSKTLQPVFANAWFDVGLAFVIVGLLVAAVGSYLNFFQRKTTDARLRPRYGSSPPYRRPNAQHGEYMTEHLIGISNPSGNPMATGVRLVWAEVSPQPHLFNERFSPAIPCAVPRDRGGDPGIGIDLPPGREELWVVISTWIGPDGVMAAGEFAPDYGTARGRWGGLPYKLAPGDRLRFVYKVLAENLPSVTFSLVMTVSGGQIQCDLEG